MSSLKAYDTELDYSYAPGMFPTMECLLKRPESVRRVLIHSKIHESDGAMQLIRLCSELKIRVEEADKVLQKISGKDNCFAAAVFGKFQDELSENSAHVVLHNPSDQGNVGTILRTCLGLGLKQIALIRPCADVFDPKVIRASMGALFSVNIVCYDHFDQYSHAFPGHHLYPFMLDGSQSVNTVPIHEPYTLIFGNEGRGLPPTFSQIGQPVRIVHSQEIDSLNLSIAVGIGAYVFVNREGR